MLRKFPALRSAAAPRQPRRPAAGGVRAAGEEGDCQGLDYADDVRALDRRPGRGGRRTGPRSNEAAAAGGAPGRRPGRGRGRDRQAGEVRLRVATTRWSGWPSSATTCCSTEKQTDADAMASGRRQSSALEDDAGLQTLDGPRGRRRASSRCTPRRRLPRRSSTRRGGGRRGLPLERPGRRPKSLATGFHGAAGVVRFSGGAVEVELTTAGLPDGVGAAKARGPTSRRLPGSTAVALSLAFRDGWMDDLLARSVGRRRRHPGEDVRAGRAGHRAAAPRGPREGARAWGDRVGGRIRGRRGTRHRARPDHGAGRGPDHRGPGHDHPGPRPAQARPPGRVPTRSWSRSGDGVVVSRCRPGLRRHPAGQGRPRLGRRRSATWSRGPTGPAGCST